MKKYFLGFCLMITAMASLAAEEKDGAYENVRESLKMAKLLSGTEFRSPTELSDFLIVVKNARTG
jgi:hypothetical protein